MTIYFLKKKLLLFHVISSTTRDSVIFFSFEVLNTFSSLRVSF